MATIKSVDDLEEYFLQLCKEHAAIRHTDTSPHFHPFKGMNIGKNMNYPCVIWVPPDVGLMDKLSDNIQEAPEWDVWIVKPVKADDRKELRKVIKECDAIAWEFICRINKDRKLMDNIRPFAYIDMNTIKRTQVGPFSPDNAYGISLSGRLSYPRSIAYDSTKWKI